MSQSKHNLLHAVFLVSGTSVGGGMLAQPVAASLMGFVPSALMMGVAYAFMMLTALILAEVCMWMPQDSHIISMANTIIGWPAKLVAWLVYLFVAYFSLIAYISGGGDTVETVRNALSFSEGTDFINCLLFVLAFGVAIEVSSRAVSTVNTMLFFGLIASYLVIVVLGMPDIHIENYVRMDFSHSYAIIPLFLTSFSFQMIVPSLANFLDRDRRRLRLAIVLGISLSFCFYLVWNAVVLGHAASLADTSLAEAYAQGRAPTVALASGGGWFGFFIHLFGFCAIVTSFMGISWGLFDFLADGFSIKKVGMHRLYLWLLVMVPPFLVAASYPQTFITALESTGAYGDTILNGLIPILMFYMGIKLQKRHSQSRFLQNPALLIALSAFALLVIGLELFA